MMRRRTCDLTVLGTADLHGHIFNWDYYRDAEYDDGGHNDVGVAKLATLVAGVRAERRGRPTLLLDAGDTIQGTPLATFYAKQEPITETGETHPMARAMNLLDYTAVTLGNHEFNYGLPLLDAWIRQLRCPALAANAVHVEDGRPAFRPYLMVEVPADPDLPPVRVGILGLTNPGTAVWDRSNVEGRLRFEDMVASAARWVPVLRADGADVVVVSAHAGDDGRSSYGPDLPNENPSAVIAAQVPGIDAILLGHAHAEVVERFVTNGSTGVPVLLAEPGRWGQRLSRMDFTLARERDRWVVTDRRATMLDTRTVPEDPRVCDAVRDQHARTVAYVGRKIATSVTEMSTVESRYRATPLIDLVNRVQADTVAAALAGTPYAGLPVLSAASPFSRTAMFPAGRVRIRDVAGLYPVDNTLEAVVLSGAEVRAYLEHAARSFRTLAPGVPAGPTEIINPMVPDYNCDMLSGVRYDIDISRPVGGRIVGLADAATGAPLAHDDRFVVAVNNYRRGGGGGFPGVVKTPVYNAQREIRQLLIEWAQARGCIDPADFHRPTWRLVRDGVPVF